MRKPGFPAFLLTCLLCLGVGGSVGCILKRYGYDNTLRMDPRVVALDGLNTPYDDFNATAPPPPLSMDALMVFASNAESGGAHFQIDSGRLRILQPPFHHYRDRKPARPTIESERAGRFAGIPAQSHNLRGPTALVRTAARRRTDDQAADSGGTVGPNGRQPGTLPAGPDATVYQPPPEATHHFAMMMDVAREPLAWENDERLAAVVWMFDSDQDGRRNLYFVDAEGTARPFFGNVPDADDAYATYDFKRHTLYFSSNRSGAFAIYRVHNTSGQPDVRQWLGNASPADRIERVDVLASEGDTLAPHIEGDTLVFASNRPGGHGGFDLYLSRHGEDGWEAPVNVQDLVPRDVRVNTAANEFRPCMLNLTLMQPGHPVLYHDWRVLIFSSDRPGGKGGYDLYLTALP